MALKQVFPETPEQDNAMRDLKASCRTYGVKFLQTNVYEGDGTGSAVVVAETVYRCEPRSKQTPPARKMTDVFRLQMAADGQWLIQSLGSFGSQ
jgi:hypothetical protein